MIRSNDPLEAQVSITTCPSFLSGGTTILDQSLEASCISLAKSYVTGGGGGGFLNFLLDCAVESSEAAGSIMSAEVSAAVMTLGLKEGRGPFRRTT